MPDTTAEPMTIERAKEINSACCDYAVGWLMSRPGQTPPDYTLREMLAARDIMMNYSEPAEGGGKMLYTTCDDRLIAALYVAANYPPESNDATAAPILVGQDRALFLVRVTKADIEEEQERA